MTVSGPAQCSLALRPARSAGLQKRSFPGVLQVIRRLLTRPGCFRLERELAGPDFHRGEPCTLARHTHQLVEGGGRDEAVYVCEWRLSGNDSSVAVGVARFAVSDCDTYDGVFARATTGKAGTRSLAVAFWTQCFYGICSLSRSFASPQSPAPRSTTTAIGGLVSGWMCR